jgi:hypothetical protein
MQINLNWEQAVRMAVRSPKLIVKNREHVEFNIFNFTLSISRPTLCLFDITEVYTRYTLPINQRCNLPTLICPPTYDATKHSFIESFQNISSSKSHFSSLEPTLCIFNIMSNYCPHITCLTPTSAFHQKAPEPLKSQKFLTL